MDQKTAAEIIRASHFFDEAWYRRTYPDVAMLDLDPALHYVLYGAGLGRDPSPAFNTRFYFATNPEVLGEKVNPLLHLLAAGPDNAAEFSRLLGDVRALPHPSGATDRATAEDAATKHLASSADLVRPHFDMDFYREQGACVPAEMDPVEHYLVTGWRLGLAPNRWFDPLGYVALNRHIARTGINPFLHFLRTGLAAGSTPNPFFRDRFFRHPDLERPGLAEYGPISQILKYCEAGPGHLLTSGRICVHVHAFYLEMLVDVHTVLRRIPAPFTLLVSISEGQDAAKVQTFFEMGLDLAVRVVVRAVPNRGRDAAPWVVHFRDDIVDSDIFCHFHTKHSSHSNDHKYWFRFLCHSILGSQEIVSQILRTFSDDQTVGLVSPAYWPLVRRQPNFGKAKPEFDRLLSRLNASGRYDHCPDFPAGSFFWCRTRILIPLFEAGLTLTDFPEEQGQVCGTLGHAVERALNVFSTEAGLRTVFVAPDWSHELAEQRPLEIRFSPDELTTNPRLTVSVIIPSWNRRQFLLEALNSAFNQTLAPKEVIVIGDGSTDGTVDLVRHMFADQIAGGQLKLIAVEHRGVSSARNTGLDAASGDIITYLDSNNTWRPEYLAHVVTVFERYPNALSGYADFVQHERDRNRTRLHRRSYDRAALLQENFIDLNVFFHRRAVLEHGYRFDPGLKRLMDWDFIIGVTSHRAPIHVDYVGADYNLDKAALGNITHTMLLGQDMARVQQKHRRERLFYRREPLSFAIKCPAPIRDAARAWGDLHFAMSLCSALERLGCRTRIDLLEAWESEKGEQDDVVVVLRGLSRYKPKPQHINFMWHISRPDKVGLDEMREFDHVFVASYSETQALHPKLGVKVSVLMQCSDPELFHGGAIPSGIPEHDLLFVGNSCGVDRWMPKTCVERGLPVAVYGRAWGDQLPASVVRGTQVRNQTLSAYYRSAKIVLNDHWPDMAKRGFISNRIFDAGLSGALVLSDSFAGEEIFFGSVITCRDGEDLEEKVRFFLANEPVRRALGERLRQTVAMSHTFDHRARELVRVAQQIAALRLGLPAGAASSNSDGPAPPLPVLPRSSRDTAEQLEQDEHSLNRLGIPNSACV